MYKPPENVNRVKSIKSKFEKIDNNENEAKTNRNRTRNNLSPLNKSKTELSLDYKPNLSRQLSDPSKCNIKRTPAFRLDKTTTEKSAPFQRNGIYNRSHHFETKVKQFNSAVKNNCDKNKNLIYNNNNVENSTKKSPSEKNNLVISKINPLSANKQVVTNVTKSCFPKTNGSLSVNKNCDNSNIKLSNNVVNNKASSPKKNLNSVYCSNTSVKSTKPLLIKSKSSIDFAHLLSKFDNIANLDIEKCKIAQKPVIVSEIKKENNQRENIIVKPDLSLLYTEPIPKALRIKNCHKDFNTFKNDIPPKPSYEAIDEVLLNLNEYSEIFDKNNCHKDIHNASTLKISDKTKNENNSVTNKDQLVNVVSLTDTLKSALKRPLPSGPAPQKPPRTFIHSPKQEHSNHTEKNSSFLHIIKDTIDRSPKLKSKLNHRKARSDPKYMLNKLENALRNNKLRSKKQIKLDISTSGDDSDDSVLFKSKSKMPLPSLPFSESSNSSCSHERLCSNNLSFNCLNNFACAKSPYAAIKETNSNFFVDCKKDEHVYAEPFHFRNSQNGCKDSMESNNEVKRNSLYYMSSPVQCCEDTMDSDDKQNGEASTGNKDSKSSKDNSTCRKVILSENSSLSSFTSDFDSATSTPLEETKSLESPCKIKQLIESFEKPKLDTLSPEKDLFDKSVIEENNYSSHRIEELKNSLCNTLDKCFTNDNHFKDMMGDTDNVKENGKEKLGNVDDMVNKFQTYVRKIKQKCETKIKKDNSLFYCLFIVEWINNTAQIKFKFPYSAIIPHKLEDLCYPEASSGPLDRSNNAQCYSLVITNDKGERSFGYCRRVCPEGSNNCLPLAYCILSKNRAPRFYKKILQELESRHGIPEKDRDQLIRNFYRNSFPRPGESIKISLNNICSTFSSNMLNVNNGISNKETEQRVSPDLTTFVLVHKSGEYGTLNKVINKHVKDYENIYINSKDLECSAPSLIAEKNGCAELILTLHQDTRYEDADLKPLHKLSTNILIKIFASLLLERKVILVSCVLSKLSSCIEALQSILYPFSWPHTLIPILPQSLWDIVESPTPVLCGVLSVAVVNEYTIEDGLVVDLDEASIIIEQGDEDKILSSSMIKAWNRLMNLAKSVPADHYVHSVYLADSYLMVFIVCLGNYKDYITEGVFQKETFIAKGKTKGIRRFLQWFTDTNLFQSFIETVINDPDSMSVFDTKIQMYASKESESIVNKLLEWKR